MSPFFFFRSIPVGPEQILLRGANLRNTQWVFGEFWTIELHLIAVKLSKKKAQSWKWKRQARFKLHHQWPFCDLSTYSQYKANRKITSNILFEYIYFYVLYSVY